MDAKIATIVNKSLANKEWGHLLLKRTATAILEMDEYEDGAILSDEDFKTLNAFAEVF